MRPASSATASSKTVLARSIATVSAMGLFLLVGLALRDRHAASKHYTGKKSSHRLQFFPPKLHVPFDQNIAERSQNSGCSLSPFQAGQTLPNRPSPRDASGPLR